MRPPPPSAEAQIVFLQQLQRLIEDGEFQATYKFALLLAIAELAVELGDDAGGELMLPMTRVAEKFAELYWRQISPYASGEPHTVSAVLVQNRGTQVELVRRLEALHSATAGNLARARDHRDWSRTISAIGQLIRKMPLHRLQVIDGEPRHFLYGPDDPPEFIRLMPGVALNLRRYQSLVQQLARARWVEHIRSNRLNAPMLGSRDDLETFMFGSSRSSLQAVREALAKIQSRQCFYCGGRIDSAAEVDHFIAWARYPRDSAHNFVLAHRRCNNAKRDLLAAKPHLERWLDHLFTHGDALSDALGALGFLADPKASRHVAGWAYRRAVDSGSHGWLRMKETELLGCDCLALFEPVGT